MQGAPQDVVIGLDYSWTQGLYMDPRDALLYKVPLPTPRRGRPQDRVRLHAALPAPNPLRQPPWDSFDLLTCEDNHERQGITHSASGYTLLSVTASGEDEEEQLKEFKASLPKDLLKIVDDHPNLFAPPDRIPPERSVKHYIHVSPSTIPTRSSPYNLSGSRLEAMREQVTDLADKGWIQPSSSPWASPILFVSKDGGTKWRLCTDLRNLNALTKKDAFPLPRLDSSLHKAATATVFSKLDLASGFHQIAIHPDHRELTAFVLPEAIKGSSFWEWTVMPFGLVNAPATFQRAMSIALQGCEDCAIVYIDDILIYSQNHDQHLVHLKRVFTCLEEHHYHVRLAKCQFLQKEVTFLGHTITPEGIQAADHREQTLQGFKTPFCRAKQVKSFLGLVMWYKAFVPHAATLAAPLFSLTSAKRKFVWTEEAEQATRALKDAICKAPILMRYNAAATTRVTTDASTVGLGAALEQKIGEDWRPIAFWSRKLRDAETRYSATDLEWLAVVEAVTRIWRHLLEDISFTIRSDHQALQRKLHKATHDPPISARQARWIERLMPFALTFEYLKGTDNIVADALSRNPSSQLHTVTVISAQLSGLLARMTLAAAADTNYVRLLQQVRAGSLPEYEVERDLVVTLEGIIVVPQDHQIRTLLLSEAHDSRLGGHFGAERTLEKMRRMWTWKGIAKDVEEYVLSCPQCQVTRIDTRRARGHLMPILAPEPWHTVTMDFVGGLAPAIDTGHTYCFVMVDKFSKYVLLEGVSESITSAETAAIFIRRVIAAFGVPVKIISDRGSLFTASVWKETMNILGTNIALAATHHPQTDGQSERTIQTLIRLFRCFTEQQQGQWEKMLPLFEFALNDAHCDATGSTPFRVLYGKDPTTPFRFVRGEEIHDPPLNPSQQEAELNRRLGEVNTFIRQRQEEVAARMKERFDRARRVLIFEPGDLVLLSTKSHPRLEGNRKQGRIRIGPYVIKAQRNANAYELEGLPAGIPAVQNITFLTPYHTTPIRFADRPAIAGTQPELIDGELEWEVEKILDYRQNRRGQRRYLVQWAGTPQQQWMDEELLNHCTQAIRDYFEQEGLPLPAAVKEFCLSAEAEDGQSLHDTDSEMDREISLALGQAPI